MKFDKVLVILLIFAFIIRALIIFVPTFLINTNFLVSHSITLDDALIGFKIAKNIYRGFGLSFDNIEQTNATPLTWTYMLSLFGFLDNESFILFALVLCSIFFVLSGYFIYRICIQVFGERELGLIVVFLYLFNPFFILISLNGLETALFAFFLLFSLFYYLSKIRVDRTSKINLLVLAILLSLTILTRDNGIYFLFAIIIDYLFIFQKIKIKEKMQNLFFMLILFAVFTLPLFLWRYLVFGHFISSSAYYYHHLFAKDWVEDITSALLRRTLVFLMTISVMSFMIGNIILSFLGFFISKKFTKYFTIFSPLIIFSLFEILHYSIIMPILKLRYIFTSTIIFVIGLGIMFFYIKKYISKALFYTAFLMLFLILSYFTLTTWTGYSDIGDSEIRVGILLNKHVINAAKFIENKFPNSKIGASHIGTFAYFSPSTIISDRNGKISYEATDYNINGNTYEYFKKRGVEYIAGFISPENFKKVEESDIIFSEPIRERWQLKFNHIFGYYVVVKFKKEYLKLVGL